MASFRLIVFTDPLPGREAEYDTWYNDVHLADVVAIPGVVAAQRFKLRAPVVGVPPNRHLAIYEIDSSEPEKVIDAIYASAGTAQMVITEALDQSSQTVAVFQVCSDRVLSK